MVLVVRGLPCGIHRGQPLLPERQGLRNPAIAHDGIHALEVGRTIRPDLALAEPAAARPVRPGCLLLLRRRSEVPVVMPSGSDSAERVRGRPGANGRRRRGVADATVGDGRTPTKRAGDGRTATAGAGGRPRADRGRRVVPRPKGLRGEALGWQRLLLSSPPKEVESPELLVEKRCLAIPSYLALSGLWWLPVTTSPRDRRRSASRGVRSKLAQADAAESLDYHGAREIGHAYLYILQAEPP